MKKKEFKFLALLGGVLSMQCYAASPLLDSCTLGPLDFFSCMPIKPVLPENVMEIVRELPVSENQRSVNRSLSLQGLSKKAVRALECFEEGNSLSPEIAAYFLTTIQGSIRTVICDIWSTCCPNIDPLMIARDPFKGKKVSFFAMACRNMHIKLVDIMLDEMIEQYQERKGATSDDLLRYKQALESSLIYLSYLPHGPLCLQEKIFEIYKKTEDAFEIDLLTLQGRNPFYKTEDEMPVSFASFARQSSESHSRTCDEELVNEGVRRVIAEKYPEWKAAQKMVEKEEDFEETIVDVSALPVPSEEGASYEDSCVEKVEELPVEDHNLEQEEQHKKEDWHQKKYRRKNRKPAFRGKRDRDSQGWD